MRGGMESDSIKHAAKLRKLIFFVDAINHLKYKSAHRWGTVLPRQ
jgi:hypothetical protein